VARQNGISTVRLKVSLDASTDQVLQKMVPVGIHGKNKSEVASWILREWIWHNQEDLARVGVLIVSRSKTGKSKGHSPLDPNASKVNR
jgi:hypothetical protein